VVKTRFETKLLPVKYDDIAPDGSEIRLLLTLNRGGICHCSLGKGQISKAIRHRNIEEIWYFIEGQGEVWRRQDNNEEIVPVFAGVSLTIPAGIQFQFRNSGSQPLRFVIVTMPPWPGSD
jgi:mannose-6-phosphate isomerase-like protein (cupin superfamily)